MGSVQWGTTGYDLILSRAERNFSTLLALALDVAGVGDDTQGATTPEKLKNSILTNGGIMQPIIVHKRDDGRLVCVEGNTRFYIYRSFVKEGVEGDWTMIPALALLLTT